MINRGTIRQLLMDKQQELLQQRTPLLPTGVPEGLDEAFRAIGYARQTCQRPQRLRHEDHTPMCPNGFGAPPAIGVAAQGPLTVLIARFNGMISHDTFCCTRWGVLQFAWWRRPNRLRHSPHGEEPLNTAWQIRRRVIARSDGARRWEAAAQGRPPWAMDHHAGTGPVPSHVQEESQGSSPGCPCVDHPATTNTDA